MAVTSGRGWQLVRQPASVTVAEPTTRSVPLVVSLLIAHIVSKPATSSPKTWLGLRLGLGFGFGFGLGQGQG